MVKLTASLAMLFFTTNLFATTKLRVLTVEEPPASYLNSQGYAAGYATDIVKVILDSLQYPTEIEVIPEARALTISQSAKNVLLFSFSKTAFRENKYHWIGPVLKKNWSIYSLKHTSPDITKLNQLKLFAAIGVVRGDVREEWLLNKGFTNLHSVTQHKQNVQLLLLGRLPLIAYESKGLTSTCLALRLNCENIEAIFHLKTAPSYIIMSKNSDEHLVSSIKNRYLEVKKSGELLAISQKWQQRLKNEGVNTTVDLNLSILLF